MAKLDDKVDLNKTITEAKPVLDGDNKLSTYVLRKKRFYKSVKKGDKNIFVNNKTNFKAQLHKCEKLFDNGASVLIIHGLGAAIHKAVCLALRLKEIHHNCLDLDVKTSTVNLEDTLESLTDDANDKINNRQNSAIHIRVSRKISFIALRTMEL